MSALSIWRCCRSSTADAPTVAASALLKARTPAKTTTTLVRADPPRAFVSRDWTALPPRRAMRATPWLKVPGRVTGFNHLVESVSLTDRAYGSRPRIFIPIR
jgi:hypothetical protein